VGGAIVGAVLQNRLAGALHDQAVARAGALPARARAGFVHGFANAGRHGLDVGAGQTGGRFTPPPGTPASVAQHIAAVARAVFDHAFLTAMRWSIIVPAIVLFVAAAGCLAIRRRRVEPAEAPPEAAVV
jgi:hypothetical protein